MSAITVYYDASCPLCVSEMAAIKSHDAAGEILLTDCSAADFNDSDASTAGITQERMMRVIHARTDAGEWLTGVDAFANLYRRVGLTSVANFWSHRWLAPILRVLYPLITPYRQRLSRLGLNKVYERAVERAARKALAKTQACSENQCALPSDQLKS